MEAKVPYLNMSSLTALYILSLDHFNNDPSSKLTIKHRKRNDPAWSHLNWLAAEKWFTILEEKLPFADIKLLCRHACSIFVLTNSLLTKLAGKGRDAHTATLTEDELQVFRNAKLLDEIPALDVIQWWDNFKALLRNLSNEANVVQGREAERWTMEREIKLVSEFETTDMPIWEALNGDYYGYDIKSYRKEKNSLPHVILIEVKSFASTAHPRIFLTRNEWNKALESEPNFFLYCLVYGDRGIPDLCSS